MSGAGLLSAAGIPARAHARRLPPPPRALLSGRARGRVWRSRGAGSSSGPPWHLGGCSEAPGPTSSLAVLPQSPRQLFLTPGSHLAVF